jgi:hypothetical protein
VEQAEKTAKEASQSVSTLVAAALRSLPEGRAGHSRRHRPRRPRSVVFDEQGTPILEYGWHPDMAWVEALLCGGGQQRQGRPLHPPALGRPSNPPATGFDLSEGDGEITVEVGEL